MHAAVPKDYERDFVVTSDPVGREKEMGTSSSECPHPPFTFSAKLLLIDLDLKVAKLACIKFNQ